VLIAFKRAIDAAELREVYINRAALLPPDARYLISV